MTILLNELKKIFNLKIILLLLIITGLAYKIYLIPSTEVHYGLDVEDNARNMINDYGESMDEEEFLDYKEKYYEKAKEAEDYIKNSKECKDLGIYNYEEYYKIGRNNGEEKYENPKLTDLYFEFQGYEHNSLFRDLVEIENVIMCYEEVVIKYEDNNNTKLFSYEERKKEIHANSEDKSLLPYKVFQEYDTQINYVARLVLISIVLAISPVYLSDKVNKVNYLQQSSKTGRKIFNKKVTASLIASSIIIILNLIMFFIFYSSQNKEIFYNCKISGFYNTPIKSWFNITFINYILITFICVFLLGIIMSLISMYVSNKVNTYIALIGVQIPIILFIRMMLLQFLVNSVTSMSVPINRMGVVDFPKIALPVVYLGLLILSILVIIRMSKREVKLDIK
ncbi:MAG: hypothetical protein ACRC92_18150 [Peptostreptococcaceae bacterium]